jgi:hypothetical protein
MKNCLPLALLPVLLAVGAAPVRSQAASTSLGPAPWTPSVTAAARGQWTTIPESFKPTAAWTDSGALAPLAPWQTVTDLKPLSLGSIPPGSRQSFPIEDPSSRRGNAP